MASRSTAQAVPLPPDGTAPLGPAALGVAGADAPAPGGGARELQEQLGARVALGRLALQALALEARAREADTTPAGGRWSPRRTLALAVLASAALWGGVGACGYLLLRS